MFWLPPVVTYATYVETFQDSIITMIFGVGAAIAAFPPVMDFCVGLLGRKGAVIFGGFFFCLGATIQALVTCHDIPQDLEILEDMED